MKYFYDTEFLEGKQVRRIMGIPFGFTGPTIDLISIGIVAEDGREYYAISKEFNLMEAWWRDDNAHKPKNESCPKNYWIRDKVLKPIFYDLMGKDIYFHYVDDVFTYEKMKYLLSVHGKSRAQIAKEVSLFIVAKEDIDPGEIKDNSPIELYAYYAAYDHVVFMWLFGRMLNKPRHLPMFSKDLKQIIDEKAMSLSYEELEKLYCPKCTHNPLSFLRSTNQLTLDFRLKCIKNHLEYPKQDNEHNALDDAKWNKRLFDFITNI